jgi:hypothetical protein
MVNAFTFAVCPFTIIELLSFGFITGYRFTIAVDALFLHSRSIVFPSLIFFKISLYKARLPPTTLAPLLQSHVANWQ